MAHFASLELLPIPQGVISQWLVLPVTLSHATPPRKFAKLNNVGGRENAKLARLAGRVKTVLDAGPDSRSQLRSSVQAESHQK